MLLGAGLAASLAAAQPQGRAQDAPPPPDGAALPAGEAAEGMIEFSRFSEPVDLRVLIDYVSEQLGVNILIDPGLAGQSVAFSGPMQVRKEQLFELLQLVLAPSGFVVTFEEDLKAYLIRPTLNVPFNMGGEIPTTVIIPTPLVRPSAIQAAVEAALGEEKAALRLTYIVELGVILSTGSPRVNQNLRVVVEQLMEEYRAQRLHRFDLTHIAATEARDRILELVGQRNAGQPGAVQRPGAAGGAAGGGGTSVGGAFSDLASNLLLDRQGNALIYHGTAEAAEEFRQYLAMVDQPSRLVVRRYSAGSMARQITAYGSRLGLGAVTGAGGTGTVGGPGAQAGGVEAGSGFVMEDDEAGTFTYYGTEAQHQEVARLVDQFAGQTRPDAIVVQFYKLRHATAEAVAEVVQSVLDSASTSTAGGERSPFLPTPAERGRTPSNITRMSDFTPPEGEVTTTAGQAAAAAGAPETGGAPTLTDTANISVIADVPNNQIIVKATVRQQSEIRAIIERIDQRRPQVFIQVRIVSVSRDEQFSLTVETALTSPNSDVPVFTKFGLTDYGSPDLPDPSLAGITAAIIRNDYLPIFLNALQTDTDLRTEATPYLLVNDNETGSLNSTREQSFSQTNQSAGSVATTSVGGSVSAGTVLTITPQISEGGYIKLEYEVELSSFIPGTRSSTLPSDRQTNNFTSLVSVPSGSTVVVGGFTQQDVSNQSQGVPFIKDLPLIGWLFQQQGKMDATRTIYVFITPQIVRDPTFSDLRLLTRGPMEAVGVKPTDPMLEPANMPILLSTMGGGAGGAPSAEEDPS